MQIYNHYLIAQKPLRANVRWNGNHLPGALKSALEDIVSWRALKSESKSLFQGFTWSGARSYICVLRAPIETPADIYSAVKIKAIGNNNPNDPHPPLLKRFDLDPHTIEVREDGDISVEATNRQPFYGSTYERVDNENTFTQMANEKRLPGPLALGVGEYPDLSFEGAMLECSIMAIINAAAEKMRLAHVFQFDRSETGMSPERHLIKLAGTFCKQGARLNELEALFYAAGEVQRQYNDRGLISSDSDAGNFAVTEELELRPRDFNNGKIKDRLSDPQVAIYQLLSLNMFVFSVFLLRAWQAGDLFMQRAYPVSAYLEGYFGAEIFSRHSRVIRTPERMLRSLKRPKKKPERFGFLGGVEVMKYSWLSLFEPLQEVLAAEGNEYLLGKWERIQKCIGIYRSFYDNY